ncbi:MAG: histone deacetylase [Bdellovibrionales bacterium]|nr:histone deacetylase [Bdellovibrionales bacterium]
MSGSNGSNQGLKIYYNPKQTVKGNQSFSPSAGKPALLMEALRASDLPIEVLNFDPMTNADLKMVHEAAFVDGILSCRRANGFGNRLPSVAESLLWTTGSFVAASLAAWQFKENTCSPTSGFHHAHYDACGGFCTFNGLVLAAMKLIESGANKIGILDNDQHYGDGTVNLLHKHQLAQVQHYTFGANRVIESTSEAWLRRLPEIVYSFKGCEVLLYQAGADPYIRDPLGGALTLDQLKRRDEIVFGIAGELKIPVAWNLAGGYTEPFAEVIKIHLNTARASLGIFESE